jgi:uncharacterized protein YxjI
MNLELALQTSKQEDARITAKRLLDECKQVEAKTLDFISQIAIIGVVGEKIKELREPLKELLDAYNSECKALKIHLAQNGKDSVYLARKALLYEERSKISVLSKSIEDNFEKQLNAYQKAESLGKMLWKIEPEAKTVIEKALGEISIF